MTSAPAGSASSREQVTLAPREARNGGSMVAGARHGDLRTHLDKGLNVGAGHPGVGDIADDGHFQTVQTPLGFLDGEEVQKGLGGMLMETVAGVDYSAPEPLGQIMGGAAGRMANHQQVRLHGLEIVGGVHQGFALDGAEGRHRQVEGVGAEALGRNLERHTGPGAGLVEDRHHGFAPEGGNLFDGTGRNLLQGRSGGQDVANFFGGQVHDAQQVLPPEFHIGTFLACGERLRETGP